MLTNSTLYPTTLVWTEELENGPQGDGIQFTNYGRLLHEASYTQILAVADLTTNNIKADYPGILPGITRKLLKYAHDDVKNIKDTIRQQNQPQYHPHY
jgi:hypothetical protein